MIGNLNKAFDHRVRLGVMAILMANDHMDFNGLKEALELTDGNLASHISVLEKHGFLSPRKKFVGRKPMTTYTATAHGRKAFAEHLDALEHLIRNAQ